MKTFRTYLNESEQNLFGPLAKIPMPPMVNSFMVGARQYYLNDDHQQTESYGQQDPGRKFPLSKGSTDFLSAVPLSGKLGEPSDTAAMMYVFDWIVNAGLMEAAKNRAAFAQRATQELRQQLGDDQFAQMVGGNAIEEDMVYSPKAHKAIPALAEWYAKNAPTADLEPSSPIIIPRRGNFERVSMSEINDIVSAVNEKIAQQAQRVKLENTPQLHQLKFAGPDGFIEWIEDGPWAAKMGTPMKQSFRTKHGISIHNPKQYKFGKDTVNDFGGFQRILRDIDNGSYNKAARAFIQRLFSESAKLLAPNVDPNTLTPEQRQWAETMPKLATGEIRFNYGSLAKSWGHIDKHDPPPTFGLEQSDEYASYYILGTMAREFFGEMNSDFEDLTDAGVDAKQAVLQLAKKYDQNPATINNMLSMRSRDKNKHQDRVHYRQGDLRNDRSSFSRNDMNKNLKLGIAGDAFHSGEAGIGKGNWKALPEVIDYGHKYLKYLVTHGMSLPQIVQKFAGNELEKHWFGNATMEGITKFLKDAVDFSGSYSVPGVKFDTNKRFGEKISGDSASQATDSEIQELIDDKGFVFIPAKKGDTLDSAVSGKLRGYDRIGYLSRNNPGDPWKLLWPDKATATQQGDVYQNILPMFAPNVVQYGGSDTDHQAVKGDLSKISNLTDKIKAMPQIFGFGLNGGPESQDNLMLGTARGLISYSHAEPKKSNFTGEEDAAGLASSISSFVDQLPFNSRFFFGDMSDETVRRDLRKYLEKGGGRAEDLPGIRPQSDDPQEMAQTNKTILYWLDRVRKAAESEYGTKLEPVQTDDYRPEIWNTMPIQKMPQKILNAALITGAMWRNREAVHMAGQFFAKNRDRNAGQFAMVQGKEGDETDTSGNISDDQKVRGLDVGGSDRLSTMARKHKDTEHEMEPEQGHTEIEDPKTAPLKTWVLSHDAGAAKWPFFIHKYREARKNYQDQAKSVNQSTHPSMVATVAGVGDGFLSDWNRLGGNPQWFGQLKIFLSKLAKSGQIATDPFEMIVTAKLMTQLKDLLHPNMNDAEVEQKVLPFYTNYIAPMSRLMSIPKGRDQFNTFLGKILEGAITFKQHGRLMSGWHAAAASAPAPSAPTTAPQQGPPMANVGILPTNRPTNIGKPTGGGGLAGRLATLRKPQNPNPGQHEAYSFKERVLSKLREMAGTGVVTGPHPKTRLPTAQFWGEPHNPKDAEFPGDVETRNSDPTGEKDLSKRGIRKRK